MTNNMVKEHLLGLMAINMLDSLKMTNNMVKVYILGMMVINIWENFKRTKYKVLEQKFG
jgi:hypothetical protein